MSQFGAIPGGSLAALRATPRGTVSYLTVVPPNTMVTAQVNGNPASFPIGALTIDNIVYSGGLGAADIPANVDVWIGNSAGVRDVFIGRTRLDNSGNIITANTLYINEAGSGSTGVPQRIYDIIEDDDFITVVETFSAYYALPTFTGSPGSLTTLQDWNIAYVDQNEQPKPVANISFQSDTRPVGFVTPATGLYRVRLSAESSFEAISGDSITAAGGSFQWDIDGGALVGGFNLTDETIEVDYTQGDYWPSVQVTDSNAKTHTARHPLVYYDTSNRPQQLHNIQSDVRDKKGRRLTIGAYYDEMQLSDVPHGALVIVWQTTTMNDAESAYVIDYMIGWVVRERANLTATTPNISFEVLGPVPMLDRVTSVPERIEAADSPSNWQEADEDYVNIPGVVHWLFYWKLPALTALCDIRLLPEASAETWQTTNQPGFGSGDLGGTNVGGQFQRIASRAPYIFGSTSAGAIILTRDPQYLSDRSAVTTRVTLDGLSDALVIDDSREYVHRVGQVVADGLILREGSVVPVKAAAPDITPDQGVGRASLAGMVVATQDELNALAGAHWAVINNPWQLELNLNFPDVFEPCLAYRLALEFASADFDHPTYGKLLRRLFDFAYDTTVSGTQTMNVYIESVTASYQGTQQSVRLRCVPEVTFTDGVFLPIPQPSAYPGVPGIDISLPGLDPLNISTVGIPTTGVPFTGLGVSGPAQTPLQYATYDFGANVGAVLLGDKDTAQELYLSTNFDQAVPTYTNVSPTADEIRHAVFANDGTNTAYALSYNSGANQTTFYDTADIFASPVSWNAGAVLSGVWDYIRVDDNGIYVVGSGAEESDTWSKTWNFAAGQQSWEVEQKGVFNVNKFEATDGANPRFGGVGETRDTWIKFTFDAPVNLTQLQFTYNLTKGLITDNNAVGVAAEIFIDNVALADRTAAQNASIGSLANGAGQTQTWNGDEWGNIIGCFIRSDFDDVAPYGPFTGTAEITQVSVQGKGNDPFNLATAQTRYSTDGGATFAAAVNIGNAPGAEQASFDVTVGAQSALAGAITQVKIATTDGGAYANEANSVAAPVNPTTLVIPYYKFGSTSLRNNSTTEPEYLEGSNAGDGSGDTLFKVTPTGTTAITPASDFYLYNPNAIGYTRLSGSIFAVVARELPGTDFKLFTTDDAGSSWDDRGVIPSNSRWCKMQRSDTQKIYIAGGATMRYSGDRGATLTSKTYPGGGQATYIEVFG